MTDGEYDGDRDARESLRVCILAIRDRILAGGPGYSPSRPAEAVGEPNEKGRHEAAPSTKSNR